jgi:hypothetical protein
MDVIEFKEPQRKAARKARAARTEGLDPARLEAAKQSFATRRVNLKDANLLISGRVAPFAGDLVLARVEKLGQHTGVQRPDGRRARIFPGDEIIVAYGARYAPNQFESEIPRDLGPCHLVASGGMASRALSKHKRIKNATRIIPVGLLATAGRRVLNLRDYALPAPQVSQARAVPVIAVAGTAMDAGKTTAAADFIRGLYRAGMRVGAAKVTGTGACNDYFFFKDAGAKCVFDFTDFGHGSTYGLSTRELTHLFCNMVLHLHDADVDVIVLEVADGLLQPETGALISSERFGQLVDSMIFCAPDALGAMGGVDWLEHHGLHVSAVGGALTAAPLAIQEAKQIVRLPVLGRTELADPRIAAGILGRLDISERSGLTRRG